MIANTILQAVSFLGKMALLPRGNHSKHLPANFISVLHIFLKAKQHDLKGENKTRLDGRLIKQLPISLHCSKWAKRQVPVHQPEVPKFYRDDNPVAAIFIYKRPFQFILKGFFDFRNLLGLVHLFCYRSAEA